MAARSIVTSQPDVACDVCARRLLRGEQPDVFLAAGERRTVCELCAPRATHEGWVRETDSDAVGLPPIPARRGRSLFDRLRQVGKPPSGSRQGGEADPPGSEETARYAFLDEFAGDADDEPISSRRGAQGPGALDVSGSEQPPAAAARAGGGRAERAIEVFNAGDQPRRVSGLTRSLGAPGVTIRPDEDVAHLVSIVIAWELCWYLYEVDIDDPGAAVRMLAQGTELDELTHEQRRVNAVAGELGELSLSGP